MKIQDNNTRIDEYSKQRGHGVAAAWD